MKGRMLRRTILIGSVAVITAVLKGFSGPAFQVAYPPFTGVYTPKSSAVHLVPAWPKSTSTTYSQYWLPQKMR